MKRERALMLAELLREMRETCGELFPEEAWYEIHRCFAIPYVEVVAPVFEGGEWKVFLVRREAADPHWPGRPWHIPGGIWRVSQSLEEACNAVSQRELTVPVKHVREVMSYKWPDHAYANPISHVCICELEERPAESKSARFESVKRLPRNMLIHHRDFINACAEVLRSPGAEVRHLIV